MRVSCMYMTSGKVFEPAWARILRKYSLNSVLVALIVMFGFFSMNILSKSTCSCQRSAGQAWATFNSTFAPLAGLAWAAGASVCLGAVVGAAGAPQAASAAPNRAPVVKLTNARRECDLMRYVSFFRRPL